MVRGKWICDGAVSCHRAGDSAQSRFSPGDGGISGRASRASLLQRRWHFPSVAAVAELTVRRVDGGVQSTVLNWSWIIIRAEALAGWARGWGEGRRGGEGRGGGGSGRGGPSIPTSRGRRPVPQVLSPPRALSADLSGDVPGGNVGPWQAHPQPFPGSGLLREIWGGGPEGEEGGESQRLWLPHRVPQGQHWFIKTHEAPSTCSSLS